MASSGDENIIEEQAVRRTRSGRTVKAPTVQKPAKKMRKKMMLVEVEVSEEEEDLHAMVGRQISQSEGTEPEDERDLMSSGLERSVAEQMLDDGSVSDQYTAMLSSEQLNPSESQTNFIEDSNSLAQSERHFNAFATESTQDQFETEEGEDNQLHSENNFTNSFPIEEMSENSECGVDKNSVANDTEENDIENSGGDNDMNDDVMENVVPENDIHEQADNDQNDLSDNESNNREHISEKAEKDEQMEVDGSLVSSQESENKEDANPDTEVISEDELPTVQAVKVPETEEVSDDELPGPKLAELPADTEVVSEDELPTVKKEGTKRKMQSAEYDPGSPTSEPEASAAKRPALSPTVEEDKKNTAALDKTSADKEKSSDKSSPVTTPKEGKSKLPELDKYWKAVNDDPSDFTGWTYLLQYVDQVNDIEAAREAYDAFLSHYPYCYGYWRKYADYEKRKGNKKKCEDVFERGLKAIPLSVDLWLHFLNYTKVAYAENEEHIREQFERALLACGLEFRSDRLWDTYIKWETEGKRLQNVTSIYDRLLATPTQGYTTHFDNFQEHVSFHAPNKIINVDEFLTLRKEVRQMLKHDGETTPVADNPDVPPGEDDTSDDAIKSDEETKALKEKIVSSRRKLHKVTVAAVTARWNFEEGIKRPYFHVKPLERCQLKNWKEYLDYEVEQGDRPRIMVLFERCLIACALYEEFWLRYVRYLEDQKDDSLNCKVREVYERACTVHHVGKPALHLSWAIYEEATNNLTKASEILVNLEKSVPNLLQVAYRRINLERRKGDLEKCAQLYESYITSSKNKLISNNMAIKYARFCLKICNDTEKAIDVLKNAIMKDPTNQRLHLQLIDICLQREHINETEIVNLIDQFLEKDNNDAEQKILFAQRKLEFLEDFGSDIQAVQKAYEDYQKYCKLSKEKKKKDEKGDPNASKKSSKTDVQPPLPNTQSGTYGSYGNYGGATGQAANNYSQYSGQQPGYGGQYGGQYPQSGDQYQYPNWQYSQSGYGGYNQWGSYGNYY